MGLVEPGGLLLTCSCSGLLPAADFQAPAAGRGAEGGKKRRSFLAMTGASADHPVALDVPRRRLPQGRLAPDRRPGPTARDRINLF